MPTLTEYHDQRGQLVTEARSALNEIETNTDEARTAELETRHDRIMADLDKLDAKIKREERMKALEAQQEERSERLRPRGADIDGDGPEGEGGNRTTEQRQAEYRSAFCDWMRAGCDASELKPEQRSLLRAGFVEQRTQLAGTAVSGGYTVPRELASEIVSTMKDWGPMYDKDVVRSITTGSGNEFDIPTNDDTNGSAKDMAENDDIADDNADDLTFGQKRLDAFMDVTSWIKLSYVLMQDSAFDLEAFIAEAIGERLGRKANRRLTIGTGVNQPNGIVTASTLGTTAAAAAAITADELMNHQHSVNAAYRRSPKCAWMFADTTLLALRKLKNGQGNFLWQMGDIRIGQPAALLDKPYHINDDVPVMATGAKPIIFGDLGRYWVRKVGAPLVGTVREKFWPKIGLAGLIRYDGELMDDAAVKHLRMA